MNTLKLNGANLNKKEIIKAINKHRLNNKNRWYQVEIICSTYIYKLKAFNTWVQLAYCYDGEYLKSNDSSVMEQTVTEFKNYLDNLIQ